MATWHDFIDGLQDEGSTLAKDELKALVETAKSDGDAFIQRQGRKLDRYLSQLAAGTITAEEFAGYTKDLVTLTMMESTAMAQEAQTRAHDFAMRIANLVLKSLLALL
jgi:hypothetical protein